MNMMISIYLLFSLPLTAWAQQLSEASDITILTGTKSVPTEVTPTGTYQSFSSQITLGSTVLSGSSSIVGNATSRPTDTTNTVTIISGSNTLTTTLTGNASTSTASTPTATNTQPCNGWPEFCPRKYSNITMVAAHNSPFVRPGNAASNQELDVLTQLNDGIRFLQAQIQWPTNSSVPHFCHTSCDMLDAGPITDWLGKVNGWVASHPYDVITILLGNGNYSKPSLYAPFIEETGITQYVYQPPLLPMKLDNWPTLEEMIISGKRVVMFLDYQANQTAYPWLLDQFSQMWETPFDPLDRSFPCTVDRPPKLSDADAKDRLYMINHNLNVEVSLLGTSILVPATTLLNETNNATGYGSLGVSAEKCREQWGRAPNFLNVDYYNYGDPPGSVFMAAAEMNNVTYDKTCCGQRTSGGVSVKMRLGLSWALLVGFVTFVVAF